MTSSRRSPLSRATPRRALSDAPSSHAISPSARSSWGAADIGIVATQANVNVGYGPQAVDLLRQGLSAEAVLERIQAVDNFPDKDRGRNYFPFLDGRNV